jgi:hypothetical protein
MATEIFCTSMPKDEETAAEMEDKFALHISIIATDILKREVAIVLVLPKQLIQ